jgi:hypothetical protein
MMKVGYSRYHVLQLERSAMMKSSYQELLHFHITPFLFCPFVGPTGLGPDPAPARSWTGLGPAPGPPPHPPQHWGWLPGTPSPGTGLSLINKRSRITFDR